MKSWIALLVGILLVIVAGLGFGQAVEIRTISQDGFPIKFNNGNSTEPGICVEIMRAIERVDTGLRFSGLEKKAATSRIMGMLENNEIDVFFGLARTPEREAKYLWLEPMLFSSGLYLFARSDDTVDIRSMDDVKKLGDNNAILVIRGANQDDYLKSISGLNVDRASIDTEANLKKLVLGRGRFYFGSDLNTYPVIKDLGLTGKVKALPVQFEKSNQYAAGSKKGNPALMNRIQAALKKLQDSGELAKIYKKYLAL